MRYMKGSKVEVLNWKDNPSTTWRPAEIISGNGRTYHVMYDCYLLPDEGVTTERVPRKAIRPCPPPVKLRSWVSGDILEVFEGNSWKPAQVSGEVGGNYFLVRILGYSRKFTAHTSILRVRQTWQEDRWAVIGKEPGKCDDEVMDSGSNLTKYILRMPQSYIEAKKCPGNHQLRDVIDDGFKEHYQVPSRSMKKRPPPVVETCDQSGRKMRAVGEKEGRGQRVIARHPYHLPKKVAAVASPHRMLGENYMHASLDHNAPTCSELHIARRKLNAQSNDAESTCSSVGSCSVSGRPYTLLYHPRTSPTQDSDSHNDEVESSCELGRNQSLPSLAGQDEDVHLLELYAYRSTMLAFHASGPLTWEKEALLTNLRLMLAISNDEHLLELRRLASANTSIHLSLEEEIPNSS